MNIAIKLPYKNAEKEYAVWATEENSIDFWAESERAARCTVSFAAMELKKFLEKMKLSDNVLITDQKTGDLFIELICYDACNDSEEYDLTPVENGLQIAGQGRVGVLYGVYEWLKMQGCRWFAPEPASEIIPTSLEKVVLPDGPIHFSPSMSLGRGFVREGIKPHGETFWLWMARNRFNMDAPCDGMVGFQKKLGIRLADGGHIFENIMNPRKVLPGGKTMWEAHSDWYGIPATGEKTLERALSTQFCFSNAGVLDYISDEIVHRLKTTWKNVELLRMSGFDTWGSTCQCDACKNLGNATDQFLHFASAVREKINRTHLNRKVQLSLGSYEGTSSLEPPQKDIPENLIEAGDRVTFYPIVRCYEHEFGNPSCHVNDEYYKRLKGWLAKKPSIPMMIGEYYNVTKFEDLPVLFNGVMADDIPLYVQSGVKGIVYMHVPRSNFALRALTHVLMAELAWNSKVDVNVIISDYFEKRYGKYASQMKTIYGLIEEATKQSAQWRSWTSSSILSKLRKWDGNIPEKELTSSHHENTVAVLEAGKQSVMLLEEACRELLKIKEEWNYEGGDEVFYSKLAVNPLLLSAFNKNNTTDFLLSEDYRLLMYGYHVTKLTTLLVEYYHSLHTSKGTAKVWQEIEQLSSVMDSRYMFPGAHSFNNGLVCPDELTRSQLRDVVKRCRIMRKRAEL